MYDTKTDNDDVFPLVVCCSEIDDPNWRWVEPALVDTCHFQFVRCVPRNVLEKRLRVLNLSRIRGCFETVMLARRTHADVIVTHGPTLAAWCSIFGFMFSLKGKILAHSFNFTELPNLLKRYIFSIAFKRVDRFVVFSNAEKAVYANAFSLPEGRFEFVHWGVRPPKVVGLPPLTSGNYVSAIGGNARDYTTLTSAARQLPDIPFVLVVRPNSLGGINPPPNVTVHINLSVEESMNILGYSRFMVLPLVNSVVPCGHVTIVAAMHLGKAMAATASIGVSDYVKHGENSLLVPPVDINSLALAIRDLWSDGELCARLGESGQRFALQECTEDRIADRFRRWLLEPEISSNCG
jgi:glycosyltransferase involved in cell wall biosynthesis